MSIHDGTAIDVLLVEDDVGDGLIARAAFEDEIANRLHIVGDGRRALDFLYRRGAFTRAPVPGLVLLDTRLPDMDGVELLDVVRGDPTLAAIPVVALVGSGAERDVLRDRGLRVDAYLVKPVDGPRFLDAVREIDGLSLSVVRSPGPGPGPAPTATPAV